MKGNQLDRLESLHTQGWPVLASLIQASVGPDPRTRGEVFPDDPYAKDRRLAWLDGKYLYRYGLGDRTVPCSRGDATLSPPVPSRSLPLVFMAAPLICAS